MDACCGQASNPQDLIQASEGPPAPGPPGVSAFDSRHRVHMPADAQQRGAALLAGRLSSGDILPSQDGLAADMPPPPPPPGAFALASGRSMQVSAAAHQRAAALLATGADSDAGLDCARPNDVRAHPGAVKSTGHMPPPLPAGMFATASGRSMQVSAAAQERAASLLADTSEDAGFDAAAASSQGRSGSEAGPPAPQPTGVFAFASGRSMWVSAAAQERAASLLADAGDGAGCNAAATGSPGESAGEAGPAPPPAGVLALASGRSMQVSAAAQERAAALLADAGDAKGPDAACQGSASAGEAGPAPPPAGMFAFASGRSMQVSAAAQERAASLLVDAGNAKGLDADGKGLASGSGGELGIMPPPPAGVFSFASGRSMQVSAAAQERAAALLVDASDAEGPDAAGKSSASGSGGEAGHMPPPPGMFSLASGRSMQVSAAALQRAAAVLATDACGDAAPDTAGAGPPGAGAGTDSAQAAPPPAGMFALASGRSMQVSVAAQQHAAAVLAADACSDAAPDTAGAGAGTGTAIKEPPPAGMFALASGRSMRVSAAAQQRAAALLALCAEASPARGADAGEPAAASSLHPDLYPGIEMPSLADDSAMLQMLRDASGGMRSGAGTEQRMASASPDARLGKQMPSLGDAGCVPGGSGARPAEPAPAASPSPNPGIEMPSLGDDGAALQLLRGGEARHAAAAALGQGCVAGAAAADARAAALPATAEALPPPAGSVDDIGQVSTPCCDAGAPAACGNTETNSTARAQAGDERTVGQAGSAGASTALCEPASSTEAPEPPAALERGSEGLVAAEAGRCDSMPPTVVFADDRAEQAGAIYPNPGQAEQAFADDEAEQAGASSPNPGQAEQASAQGEAEQAGASSPNPDWAKHAAAHAVAAEARVASTVHLDEPAAQGECAEQPGQQREEARQSGGGAGGPTLDPAEDAVPCCQSPVRDLGAGQPGAHGREVPDPVGPGDPWPATDAAGPAEQGEVAAAPAPPVMPTMPQGHAAAQPDDLRQHAGFRVSGVPPTLPLGEAEPECPEPGLPPTLPLAASPQRSADPTAADPAHAHADACPAEAWTCVQGAHAAGGAAQGDGGAPGAAQAPAVACGAGNASSLRRSGSAPLQCASAARADVAELPGSKRSHSEGQRASRSSKRARRASCGAGGTGGGAGAPRDPAAAGYSGAGTLPRPVPGAEGAEAGSGTPGTVCPVPGASAAVHAPDAAGEPDLNPKPLDGAGAWATAGGKRIQVDAAKAAAARALFGAGVTGAMGSPAQEDAAAASPVPMGGAMDGAGVWAKATGKRVHVDPAKLAAAQARLGKRAPLADLAERGATEAALTPDPKRRAMAAGAGGAVGVRVRGDATAPDPDCRASEASAGGVLGTGAPSVPAPTRLRPETAGLGPNGSATPAVGAGTSTPADKQGGRALGGGRASRAASRSGLGSDPGSGQGTPAGSTGRRAPASLSRSGSGSGFKAPRRFVSPMRNPGLTRVR